MKNKLKTLLAISLLLPVTTFALEKNETVYTNLDSTGKIVSTTVVNHLVNKETGKIDDETMLTDILNVNGKETFELNNNNLKWSATGSDIFYRGKINKELPIDTKVTYYLNDKKMDVKDMIGKSGTVKIKLSFDNKEVNTVLVNGRYTKLYTPFVVTVGTILDSNSTNINITNGKVVNTGTKNFVVGLASPGLYESLNLDELKGMDQITITFETKKFSLNNIYVVSTPKLLDSNDLKIFDKLDVLYNSVSKLQTSMNEIENGSTKLKDGSLELKTKLNSAIEAISANTGDALTDEQVNGIKQQAINSISLVYTDEYKQNLANNVWNTVRNSLDPNDVNVVSIVTDSVTNSVVNYLKDVGEYDDYVACETGKAIVNQGGSMTQEQITSCGVIQADTTLPLIKKYASMASKEVAQNTSSYVAENVSKSVSISVSEETAKQVASNVSETVSKNVANQVKSTLLNSVEESLSTLYNGVTTLDSGINELNGGIVKFNKEGINTLSNYSNLFKNYSDKTKALVELSNSYKGYSSNNSTKTLFISMVKSSK